MILAKEANKLAQSYKNFPVFFNLQRKIEKAAKNGKFYCEWYTKSDRNAIITTLRLNGYIIEEDDTEKVIIGW